MDNFYTTDVPFAKNINQSSFDELSVNFIRSIQSLAGKQTSISVLQALRPILGKDWSGRILYNIVADNYKKGGEFVIVGVCAQQLHLINAIKLIRMVTSLSLKEAKDLLLDVKERGLRSPISVDLNLNPTFDAFIFIGEMHSYGFEVVQI